MAATAENPRQNWGLIAGNGDFPFLVLEGARSRGIEMAVIAIREEASPALERAAKRLPLGQPRRAEPRHRSAASGRREARGDGRPGEAQQNFQLDSPRLAAGETAVFAAVKKYRFADRRRRARAARTKASSWWTPRNFSGRCCPPTGVLTRRAPDEAEAADIAYGREIAQQIAGLDLGQTVVVRDRACVAIEAMEGTDETIERAARIAGGQRLVVVKVSKPKQDMRFDVPVVGAKTIEVMRRSNATALAIDAGRTLLFERDALIRAADDAGIAIQAFPPEREPTAPIGKIVSENPIRVAVVGAGEFGRNHVRVWREIEGAELVGIVDANRRARRRRSPPNSARA